MGDIINQLGAKSKAMDVINSCISGLHFQSAENYIELYNQKFEDFLGYNELKRELQRVRVESLTPRR
tara:strand:+ start:344 stop:544 length:201 start_codon:yes stop_codon:yes gene_type:complete